MKLLFAESDFWQSSQELQAEYEQVVSTAFADARALLPQVVEDTTFVVQPAAYECIPETGEGAWTRNGQLVLLWLDPVLPYGKDTLLQNVRAAVFHELNHAARFMVGHYHGVFLDYCIMEGLATVFAREHAQADMPWGQYDEAQAKQWLDEITAKQDALDFNEYMYHHSDGRRWIGYKVGTYIIGQALKASGKDILQLTAMPCEEIKASCGVVSVHSPTP